MKNLSPRQRKILDALTQKGDLTMEEIRALTGVSQATAYREIQSLVAGGWPKKLRAASPCRPRKQTCACTAAAR